MKKINFFVISVVIFFTHFSLLFAMPNDEKKALIKKMAEYHSANRVEDSLLCLEKILADNPRDDEALYYRAFIYLEMNKPQLAIADLDTMLNSGIRDYETLHLHGCAQYDLGKYEKAI
ncbi:MAG: CDC27 family protein, partial [Treponema sp.]|nr:CDC27 family protein [Treponema sp.]